MPGSGHAAASAQQLRADAASRAGRRTFLLLVNDGAREGRAAARLDRLLARAPALAARARVAPAPTLAEAVAAVAGLGADEWPVAAGGDGTVGLVARALREAGVHDRPLGILPLGTGNAVAHSLHVGTAGRAVAALLDGVEARLDLLVTDRPEAPLALCSISAGFEGAIFAGLGGCRGARRAAAMLRALPHAWRERGGLHFVVDGATLADPWEPVFNAGLYNLPCYAFGRVVHPDADGADGHAEAVVHPTAASWLAALREGLPTAPPRPGPARTAHVARAGLRSSGPIQVDGEPVAAGTIEVAIEQGALRIVAGATAVRGHRPLA
jgi:hypothetical protein